jgi:hypothetical protein
MSWKVNERAKKPPTIIRTISSRCGTDTGESAGEGENEGECKRKGTGDSRGSKDLQDIREIVPKATRALIGRATDAMLNIRFYKVLRIIRLESRSKS